jgi:hypothetical protein
VIERPDLDLSREEGPQTDSNIGAGDRDGQRGTGGGNHRLLLVNSEQHSEVLLLTLLLPLLSDFQQPLVIAFIVRLPTAIHVLHVGFTCKADFRFTTASLSNRFPSIGARGCPIPRFFGTSY